MTLKIHSETYQNLISELNNHQTEISKQLIDKINQLNIEEVESIRKYCFTLVGKNRSKKVEAFLQKISFPFQALPMELKYKIITQEVADYFKSCLEKPSETELMKKIKPIRVFREETVYMPRSLVSKEWNSIKLDFFASFINKNGIKALMNLRPEITGLKVRGFDEEFVNSIDVNFYNEEILASNELKDDDLEILLDFESLTSLSITYCYEITNNGLSKLMQLKNLKVLEIIGNNQVDGCFLAGSKTYPNLRKLNISNSSHILWLSLKYIKNAPNLEELILKNNDLFVSELTHISHLTNLRVLDLSENRRITSETPELKKVIKSLPKLTRIPHSLSDNLDNLSYHLCPQ